MTHSMDSRPDANYDSFDDVVYCRDIDAFLHDPQMDEGYTYIYFILCEVSEINTEFNRIKIGIGYDPFQRLYELQTGCPFELKVLYQIKVPTGVEFQLEKILHKKFKRYKARGEWFIFNDDIRNWMGFHSAQLKLKYKDGKRVYKLRKKEDKQPEVIKQNKPKIKQKFFEVCPRCLSENIELKASNKLKGMVYELWCRNCDYFDTRYYKNRRNPGRYT